MRKYRIEKVKTNLDREFYTISSLHYFLFFPYWDTETYEESISPVEYTTIKEAEAEIENRIMLYKERTEEIVISRIIKEY